MKKFILAFAATALAATTQSQTTLPAGQWTFGLNTGSAFAAGTGEKTLFRGNSLASKFFAEYHFNWGGIGVSTGLLPGSLSDASISQFLTDRKIQAGQVTLTKANPFNSYFLVGPSFQFGKQVLVRAQAQGGFFLNNPGSLSIVPNGATRALYRFDAGKKSLFPGFAGSLQIAYPLSNTTRFTLGTDFLQTQSSIRLLDTQNGIDIPAEQNRPVRLFTAGIGILKTFGSRVKSPRDIASGQASGRRVLPTVNKKEISIGEPGVQRSIISPRDPQSGLPTGRRDFSIGEPGVQSTVQNNCGGVTEKITSPDGTIVERSFACPDDASAFNQALRKGDIPNRISMNVTTPKQTQGSSFGEKVNSGMQQAGSALANGKGLTVISGRLVRGSAASSSGILTNNAVSSVGNLSGSGGGAAAASYARMAGTGEGLTAVLYSREAGSGMASGKRGREAGSGLATGRRQYQPIFNENGGGSLQPEVAEVSNNPLYKGNKTKGNNPLHNGRTSGVPDTDCDGVSGILVELIDAASGTVAATTVTGNCGEFWFARVPEGNYQVHVTGTVSAKKSYDVTLKGSSAQDLAGQMLYPNEQWSLEINSGDESDARINTSRSNLKNIAVVEADTDGDGSYDQLSVMGSFSDGSSKDITTQCAVTRSSDGGKEISIPLNPGNQQRAGKAKYKNIILKRGAIGDSFTADAEKLEGGKEGLASKVSVTTHPGVIQYQINTADLDGDGAADQIWSPRSNVNPESGMRKGWDGTVKGLAVSTGDLDGDGQAEFLLGGAVPGASVISAALRPGNPIGGLTIKGGKNPGGLQQNARTNSLGEFEFTDWAPGSYRIEAELTYHIDESININAGDVEGDGIASRKGWDGTVKGKQSQSASFGERNNGNNGEEDPDRAFNQNSSRSNHTYRPRHVIEADVDGDGEWETRFLSLDDEIASISIGEPGVQRTLLAPVASAQAKQKEVGPVKWMAPESIRRQTWGDPHENRTNFALLLQNGSESKSVPRNRWKATEASVQKISCADGTLIVVSAKGRDYPAVSRISLNGLPPGQPVLRAALWLVDSNGTVAEKETDEQGRISLNGLPPGQPYRIRVNLSIPADEDLLLLITAENSFQLRRAKHDTAKNTIQNAR